MTAPTKPPHPSHEPRTPTTLHELSKRVEPGLVKPETSIPRLPESSPWSSPANWGEVEPPLGAVGLDCGDTVGVALGGASSKPDEEAKDD